MKTRLLALPLTLVAFGGCSDSSTNPAPPSGMEVVRAIDDLNYIRGRFFFIVRPARTLADGGVVDFATLHVYMDDLNGANNQGTVSGYGEIDATAPEDPSKRISGAFDELLPLTHYSVSTAMYGDRFPVLELKYSISRNQVLAITYEETLPGGTRRAVGGMEGDTLRAQLLQAPSDLLFADAANTDYYEDDLAIAPFNQVRDFELKNVYDLQTSNIDPATLQLEVRRYNALVDEPNDRVIDGGKVTSYIQILGLDLFRDLGLGTPITGPDGAIDRFTNANFIDPERGLVWFPDLRPFDPRITGRADARPEEDEFWKTRVAAVDNSIPGLRKLVLWPEGAANPPGSAESPTQVQLWSNPRVYDKRNILVVVDRKYYLYAKFRSH
jgi:hypothetical protein